MLILLILHSKLMKFLLLDMELKIKQNIGSLKIVSELNGAIMDFLN